MTGGRAYRIELFANISHGFTAARGSERLSNPCSDRQPLRVGRPLYLSILGILKDDL
ncbi:MAG: hypothetical protein ABSH33_20235 [Steroidobacteraceae bacterium]|jgi:hypothetical protein